MTRLTIVVSHPIQHFVGLYRALSRETGLECRVLFGSRDGLQPYFDREMGVEIAWQMDLTSEYDHQFLRDTCGLDDALGSFAPDAVIVYGYRTSLTRATMRWAARAAVPLMMISDSELRAVRSPLRRLAKRLMLPSFYRRIAAFLSVGDANDAYYRHYGVPADRLFRSPFPIDEVAYRAAAGDRAGQREALFATLGLRDETLLVLFVGKLSARKRPLDLLAAVDRARGLTTRPVHAVFAGDGEGRAMLEQRIAKDQLPASLLGFVNVNRLPSIYAACDVLFHPAMADPHPLTCSEAACVGLPMILSDRVGAEGPTDIANDGDNAIVVPVGDIDGYAAAIARLANDPALLAAMGQRSRARFDSQDMRASVAGIRRALESLSTSTSADR